MAKAASSSKVALAKQRVKKAIKLKRESQKKQGKKFVADSRVGVIPERIWKQHKEAAK